MGDLQNNEWGGEQQIDGDSYQTYCGGNGDCDDTDWAGGQLYAREGYHCYTSNFPLERPPLSAVPTFELVANDQANSSTHPFSVSTIFPDGGGTSGFGGTGVSAEKGGLGKYGGH